MLFRPPMPTDLPDLNAMILRSKAVWGYDEAFMAACEEELRLTPAHLAAGQIECALDRDTITGVVQLSEVDGALHLEKLFISPDYQGQGIGRSLMGWAVSRARLSGCQTIHIDSDPGAVPFYERMGARRAGEVPSGSVPGRMLPRLELQVATKSPSAG